jgi:hypothetical protein
MKPRSATGVWKRLDTWITLAASLCAGYVIFYSGHSELLALQALKLFGVIISYRMSYRSSIATSDYIEADSQVISYARSYEYSVSFVSICSDVLLILFWRAYGHS